MNRRLVLCAAAVLVVSSSVHSQSTWLGGTGSWSDPTMWSGGVIPTEFLTVNIDGGNTAVNSLITRANSDDPFQGGITIDAGDTLVAPTLVVPPPFLQAGLIVNGKLELNGSGAVLNPYNLDGISLAGTGEIHLTGPNPHSIFGLRGSTRVAAGLTIKGGFSSGYFFNFGTLLVEGVGNSINISLQVTRPAYNENGGTMSASAGALIRLDGFINQPAGVISVESGATLRISPGVNDRNFTNNGSIRATDAAVLVDPFPWSTAVVSHFSLTRSTVTNTSSATLGLASLTGTNSITGNAASEPSSLFSLALAAPGSADLLYVTGSLDLTADDHLDLSSLPGTLPNTPYTLITASSITGTFEHVTPGFNVQYTPTSVIVTAIPEPFLSSLACLAAASLLRRRTDSRRCAAT